MYIPRPCSVSIEVYPLIFEVCIPPIDERVMKFHALNFLPLPKIVSRCSALFQSTCTMNSQSLNPPLHRCSSGATTHLQFRARRPTMSNCVESGIVLPLRSPPRVRSNSQRPKGGRWWIARGPSGAVDLILRELLWSGRGRASTSRGDRSRDRERRCAIHLGKVERVSPRKAPL